MSYVYLQTEEELWTTGHYDPSGKWHPESDHSAEEEAASRAVHLNGGPTDSVEVVETKVTYGYRKVGSDSRRTPGWDGVEHPGMGGTATEEWAYDRAARAAAADGGEYEIVRREIRYTAWEPVGGSARAEGDLR